MKRNKQPIEKLQNMVHLFSNKLKCHFSLLLNGKASGLVWQLSVCTALCVPLQIKITSEAYCRLPYSVLQICSVNFCIIIDNFCCNGGESRRPGRNNM